MTLLLHLEELAVKTTKVEWLILFTHVATHVICEPCRLYVRMVSFHVEVVRPTDVLLLFELEQYMHVSMTVLVVFLHGRTTSTTEGPEEVRSKVLGWDRALWVSKEETLCVHPEGFLLDFFLGQALLDKRTCLLAILLGERDVRLANSVD